MLIGKDANNNLIPVLVDATGRLLVSDTTQPTTTPTGAAVRVQTTFTASARVNVTIKTFDLLKRYRLRRVAMYNNDNTAGNYAIPSFFIGGAVQCPLTDHWVMAVTSYKAWDIDLWIGGAWVLVMDCWVGINGKSIETFAYWDEYPL